MTKFIQKCIVLFLLSFLFYPVAHGQTLVHYWNFNDNTSQQTITTPTVSLVTGAEIEHIAGGSSVIDFAGGNGQNFDVENLNARNGDPAGTHLRFNDPIGGGLVFDLPTTGFENIIVKFATRRSGQGAGTQLWSYTTDGTNFVSFGSVFPANGNPVLETLDFSSISEVNNNPNFALKVEFEAGSGGTGGNNRFDNFTLDAETIGGGDPIPPVATITPTDGSINISVTVNPTISFNENVRLLNDDPIDNDNVDSLVELRLNDASGEIIPFDASFSDNIITILPLAVLEHNQTYYAALLPNMVEDFSDNAITETVFSQFTTITEQTLFEPGDLAFVAYRMNATNTEDEIAFITFVDIIPGTFITFTDSKYTSNPQPQCPNGIVWTVGSNECVAAGTVVTIQTESFLTNIGTVTGTGFGLSSNGDQVIVYAGTAAEPSYITALSSNGWVTNNTSCGGSLSMIPAGLTDGESAFNTATAPGNTGGNAVNAYYNGTQEGTVSELRMAILNPENWIAIGSGTSPQQWPVWNFPGSIQIVNTEVLNTTTIELTFSKEPEATSGSDTNNYTGIPDLLSAVVNSNVVTLTYGTPFESGVNYELTVNNIEAVDGSLMACAYNFEFNYNTTLSLNSDFIVVNEDAGIIELTLNLQNPSVSSVDLVVKGTPFSTANSSDFNFETQTLQFDENSSLTQVIQIEIIDDSEEEQQAEYLVLSLENPVGLSVSGNSLTTVYIIDNDRQAPVPTQDIELNYIGSFDPSGNGNRTCEIVVHDPVSQRLFTTSGIEGILDIIDFSNPEAPEVINSIDMNPYGGITSVAVVDGYIAVASPNIDKVLDGSVVFFDVDGNFQVQVTVGALPDMIILTPDGTKLLTANEGEPNANYSIDPEGSVSIIDVSGGIPALSQSNVTTLYFTPFNSQEVALINSGVRKLKLTSSLSQDFEPEYITVSSDSQTAWVALQENNAIAEIDLSNNAFTQVWALGTKDMSLPGNGFDASDNNSQILIANWPVQSYYIPDAIASFEKEGINYIVTANEGDEKEYSGFEERIAVGSSSYLLDEIIYPQASMLKESHNLGRFRATNLDGDIDNDGFFEQIYSVGARSFSIFNTQTKQLVYDSGDDFEMYTAAHYPEIFNANHESNAPKNRSRAKGPEPEGVTIAKIEDRTFAFIALERIGGVMVYDVTLPENPVFVDYKNTRSTSAYEGDHGAEGIIYIAPENSPTDTGYVLVANEISGTITIFEVGVNIVSTPDYENPLVKTFVIFPNPAKDGIVYFNRSADVELYDINGSFLFAKKNALSLNTTSLTSGIYLVKTSEGIVKKLIVK